MLVVGYCMVVCLIDQALGTVDVFLFVQIFADTIAYCCDLFCMKHMKTNEHTPSFGHYTRRFLLRSTWRNS